MNNFKYIFFIIFFTTSCTPEYEERGFESEEQFLRATEAGFVEPVIYELALSKGFEDYKTYKSAIDRGFEDNDEFILANKYNLKNKSQLKKFLIDNLCTDTKSFGNICLNIPYEMSLSYPSLSSDGSIWWTSVYGQSEKIFKTSSGTYYDDATDVLKEYELAKIEKNIENADFDLSLICYDKYSGPADYGNRIIDTKSISPRIRIYKLNSILIFRSKNLISKKHLSSLPHAYSQFNEKYYRDKYNDKDLLKLVGK